MEAIETVEEFAEFLEVELAGLGVLAATAECSSGAYVQIWDPESRGMIGSNIAQIHPHVRVDHVGWATSNHVRTGKWTIVPAYGLTDERQRTLKDPKTVTKYVKQAISKFRMTQAAEKLSTKWRADLLDIREKIGKVVGVKYALNIITPYSYLGIPMPVLSIDHDEKPSDAVDRLGEEDESSRT
jgi:hypothetical protein